MGKVFDIFVLNCLWLICCIPIITIGPSTTAFFYAMMNLLEDEEHYVSKDFFGFFKGKFRQTCKAGLALTAIVAFLVLDVYLSYRSGTGIYTFFMVFFFVILLLAFFITVYTYALLAKVKKSIKEIVQWAFVLSIKHIGRSFLILFVFILGIWFCHLLPGLIFIVPGVVGAIHSQILLPVLKRNFQDTEKDMIGEDLLS